MYATEKYVKLEVKELKELINNLASDQGGDIQHLYQQFLAQREVINTLQQQLVELRDSVVLKEQS